MNFQTRLFIGGEFVDAVEHGAIETLNPHDNLRLAKVAEARAADIDRAVAAANEAFPAWRDMAAADRGKLLLLLADAIELHTDELARIESLNTGHPIRDALSLDVPRGRIDERLVAPGDAVPQSERLLGPAAIGQAGRDPHRGNDFALTSHAYFSEPWISVKLLGLGLAQRGKRYHFAERCERFVGG